MSQPADILTALKSQLENDATLSKYVKKVDVPKKDFIFGQTVLSTVNVADINGNITSEVYRFTTAASTGPWFGGTSPRRCARGVYRKHNVEVQVYAMGDGIDVNSFIFKVDRKTRDFTIVPIVYRLS